MNPPFTSRIGLMSRAARTPLRGPTTPVREFINRRPHRRVTPDQSPVTPGGNRQRSHRHRQHCRAPRDRRRLAISPANARWAQGVGRKQPEKKEAEYDLTRFKSEPTRLPPAHEPSPEALAHLHELEEEMIRNLQSKTSDVPKRSFPLLPEQRPPRS